MAVEHQTDSAAYVLGTAQNDVFLREVGDDLLAFGRGFPASCGGSLWLNSDGSTDPSRGVETWITARMAHVYSMASMLGWPGAGVLADAALKGLVDGPLRDRVHGGWHPQVFLDGRVVPGKVCYAHAFVMLAASSALLAGRPGARGLLDDAVAVFLDRFWDGAEGLAVDSWDTGFSSLDGYRGVNANMHTVEAFLAVADATGDGSWRARAGRIVERVAGWAEANGWRIPEHFSSDWEPLLEYNADNKADQFKPYGATPGHGIEWSRLIVQYALSAGLGAGERGRLVSVAERLFGRAVEDGWGTCEGGLPGLAYTTDWQGRPVVTDRMHWTLAEGIDAAATLAKVTGRGVYRDWYARFWGYADDCVIDHELGSWFHQLDGRNRVVGTVWPGKSDVYHAFQATLIPRLDPAVSVASGVRAHPGLNGSYAG